MDHRVTTNANSQDNGMNNRRNNIRHTVNSKKSIKNTNIRKKIKFLNTNAQSLQFKITELKDKLEDKEIQITGITESWGQKWKEATLKIKKISRL